jgi:hypothetical protein
MFCFPERADLIIWSTVRSPREFIAALLSYRVICALRKSSQEVYSVFQLAGASGVFVEDVVDVFEGLFEHAGINERKAVLRPSPVMKSVSLRNARGEVVWRAEHGVIVGRG